MPPAPCTTAAACCGVPPKGSRLPKELSPRGQGCLVHTLSGGPPHVGWRGGNKESIGCHGCSPSDRVYAWPWFSATATGEDRPPQADPLRPCRDARAAAGAAATPERHAHRAKAAYAALPLNNLRRLLTQCRYRGSGALPAAPPRRARHFPRAKAVQRDFAVAQENICGWSPATSGSSSPSSATAVSPDGGGGFRGLNLLGRRQQRRAAGKAGHLRRACLFFHPRDRRERDHQAGAVPRKRFMWKERQLAGGFCAITVVSG